MVQCDHATEKHEVGDMNCNRFMLICAPLRARFDDADESNCVGKVSVGIEVPLEVVHVKVNLWLLTAEKRENEHMLSWRK